MKGVTNTVYNFIFSSSEQKNGGKPKFDIDPISVLAITAIQCLKEEDSKLVFTKKGVKTQQRSENIYFKGTSFELNIRGAKRRVFCWIGRGANKDDLDQIEPAFQLASKLWNPSKNQNVSQLFLNAINGLVNLRNDTYSDKSGMTCSGIKNYEKEMTEILVEPKNDEPLNELEKKMKAIWDIEEIKMLNSQISLAFKKQGDIPVEKEVKCKEEIRYVEKLTKNKFLAYYKLIKEHKKEYELVEEEEEEIVDDLDVLVIENNEKEKEVIQVKKEKMEEIPISKTEKRKRRRKKRNKEVLNNNNETGK